MFAAQWLAIILLALLVLGAFNEIQRQRTEQRSRPAYANSPASRLVPGDALPDGIAIPLSPKSIVLFVGNGCSGCVQICQRLGALPPLQGWQLTIAVRGVPMNAARFGDDPAAEYLADITRAAPAFAQIVRDDEDMTIFRRLGIHATPTALAFVGNRLVSQVIGPDVDWFADLEQSRRLAGQQLLEVASL